MFARHKQKERISSCLSVMDHCHVNYTIRFDLANVGRHCDNTLHRHCFMQKEGASP